MRVTFRRVRDPFNRVAQSLFRALSPRFGHAPKWNPGRIACHASLRFAVLTEVCDDNFCRSVYGPWLRNRQRDRTFRFAMRGGYGCYYAEYLRNHKQEAFRFIDVGANIGLYSLLAGANPFCAAIDSFEPNDETLKYLRSNLERNDVSASVHPYAVSSGTGTHVLWEPKDHSGAASLEDDGSSGRITSTATLVGADYLRRELGASIELIVLKVDVEGHEWEVLKAFRDADLLRRTRSIWVEVSACTQTDVYALLKEEGFEARYVEGSTLRWDVLFEPIVN